MKRNKKIFAVLLCCVMSFGSVEYSFANAQSDNAAIESYAAKWDTEYNFEGGVLYFDKSTGTITNSNVDCENVVIPSEIDGVAVKKIGDGAFRYNFAIKSLEIPSSVRTIGKNAFKLCDGLTDVHLPDDIESIEDSAFFCCYQLSNINLPRTLKNLGNKAFMNCFELKDIELPEGLSQIGYACFSGCENMENINISAANPNFTSQNGILFDKNMKTLLAYPSGKQGNTYTVPSSVTELDRFSFSRTCLNEIYLHASIDFIGANCFSSAYNLKNINIDPANAAYTSDNGILFNKDKTELICYPAGKTDVSYTVPDSVKAISNDAFGGCDLQKIYLSDNVLTIGESAFSSCLKLTEIRLPAGLTEIPFEMCGYCELLKTVNIPDKVKKIDDRAFEGCTAFEEIEIPETVERIGDLAFGYCEQLKKAVVKNKECFIDDGAFFYDDNMTMYCYENSTAMEYALGKGLPYVLIDEAAQTFAYGDADGDDMITASDSACILQKVLNENFELPLKAKTNDWLKYTDVDADNAVTANDAALVLQKTLLSTFKMPAEK